MQRHGQLRNRTGCPIFVPLFGSFQKPLCCLVAEGVNWLQIAIAVSSHFFLDDQDLTSSKTSE